MNIKKCFEKKLLKRINKDKEKTKKSLEVSEDKLKDARSSFNAELYSLSILSSYMSMFHAARALLFKDGVQEKSHFAVFIYLKEKYEKLLGRELIYEFDSSRKMRHETLYGLTSEFDMEEADHFIKVSRVFVNKIIEHIG